MILHQFYRLLLRSKMITKMMLDVRRIATVTLSNKREKFQVFVNVCDNMLKEGRMTKQPNVSHTFSDQKFHTLFLIMKYEVKLYVGGKVFTEEVQAVKNVSLVYHCIGIFIMKYEVNCT